MLVLKYNDTSGLEVNPELLESVKSVRKQFTHVMEDEDISFVTRNLKTRLLVQKDGTVTIELLTDWLGKT